MRTENSIKSTWWDFDFCKTSRSSQLFDAESHGTQGRVENVSECSHWLNVQVGISYFEIRYQWLLWDCSVFLDLLLIWKETFWLISLSEERLFKRDSWILQHFGLGSANLTPQTSKMNSQTDRYIAIIAI